MTPGPATGGLQTERDGPDRHAAEADAPPPRSATSTRAEQRPADGRAFAATLVVLGLLPMVLFLVHSPGTLVRDTRLVHPWAPELLVERHAWLWTDDVGLGGITAISTPLSTIVMSGFRVVGFEPWLAQRLWLATALALAAIGTALLARELARTSWLGALVAGLWVLAAPYTINFLIPSWLFANVVAVPWMMLALIRGTTTPRCWRWAAVFTLAVAFAGTGNVPGLIYAALPLVPLAVYIRFGREVPTGRIVGWCGRAAVLLAAVFAHALLRASAAADALRINLRASEQIDDVIGTSSWSESIRGLGHWLIYWQPSAGARPYSIGVLTSSVIVLATFVVPAIAVLALLATRRRERLLLGFVTAGAIVLLVGGYSGDWGTPYGAAFNWLGRNIEAAFAFRNYYKAGGALVVAIAVLLAIAVRWGDARSRLARRTIAGGCLGVLAVAGWPMWSGQLLDSDASFDDGIPAHWEAAAMFLNEQPDDLRVTAVPAIRAPEYRWGTIADGDVLSVLVDRPVIEYDPFLPDPADSNDAMLALGEYLSSGSYVEGTLRPIAERIGLGYVVVRNDLAWERNALVRPLALQSLRDDPDLDLVAAFWPEDSSMVEADPEPVALSPFSAAAIRRASEAALPAVEVYRVRGVDTTVRVVGDDRRLLVAGDGEAWPTLARAGLLDASGPITYTGRLTTEELITLLDDGAVVALTDTNRRTFDALGRRNAVLPSTAKGQISDRFDIEGSQTVAAFGDAVDVVEIDRPGLFAREIHRPAAMFDGDDATSWLTGWFRPAGTQAVRLDFDGPQEVTGVTIRADTSFGLRHVTTVRLEFSDDGSEGDFVDIQLANGEGRAFFAPRTVDSMTIRPVAVSGDSDSAFGLSRLALDGLDLAERLVIPDDLSRRAAESPELAAALESAPSTIVAARRDGPAGPLEMSINRRFHLPAERTFELSGAIAPLGPFAEPGLFDPLIDPTSSPADDATTAAAVDAECRDDLVIVDGAPVSVRVDGEAGSLRPRLVGCEELQLASGWHELRTTGEAPIGDVVLSTAGVAAQVVDAEGSRLEFPSRNRIVAEPTVDGRLIIGQAGDEGWAASVDGESLGPPEVADLQASWTIEAGDVVDVQYGPDGTYRLLLAVAAVAMVVCLALIVWNPRSIAAERAPTWTPRTWRVVLLAGVAVLGAWFFLGLVGAAIVLAAMVLGRLGWIGHRPWIVLAALLIIGAGLVSVPRIGPELSPVASTWPQDRELASILGRVAVAFLAAALAVDALRLDGRRRERDEAVHG